MAEGRNDSTSCEGTCEDTMNLGDLVDMVTKAGADTLVKKNGYPSFQLLELMRDILLEVFQLHDKGKAHGHLRPENILISEESSIEKRRKGLHLCAKLRPDSLCLNSCKTGCEQCKKNPGCLTLSADIYSLGEIFYYCITGMPSNEWKTGRNKRDLSLVACPAAKDLISRLWMDRQSRPKANELLYQPLLWTPEKRVSFLCQVYDKRRDLNYSNLWSELRKLSVERVTGGKWDENINDDNVLNYIVKQKSNPKWPYNYDFSSVQDLVRLIRIMTVHYGELPEVVKRSVGTLYKGFDSFFTSRFPNLLIEVYKVVRKCCKEDEFFGRYFYGDALVAD